MPITFDVSKDDLATSRLMSVDQSFDKETENSVWVKTEKFAFSANNITYAAFGRSMSYWDLFPREGVWGNIPVWGNATVIKSNRQDVSVGQRLYGILPMAEETRLTLSDFMPGFLLEASSHRSSVSAVYNRYTLLPSDQVQLPENVENALVVFRPLFITAYLLAVYLKENDYFGADQVVLTSASSKTAVSLSHFLKHLGAKLKVVALTSPQNEPFVSSLPSYDETISYGSLSDLACELKTVVVDFAGDPKLIQKLRAKLNGNLARAIGIGAADWQNSERARNLPAEEADFFFAPTHINQRIQAWGPVEFQKRTTEAWMSLVPSISGWLAIKRVSGPENIQEAYLKILNNEVAPFEGYVLSF